MKNDQILVKKHENFDLKKINLIKNYFLSHILKKWEKPFRTMINSVHSNCFRCQKCTLRWPTKIYSFCPKVTSPTIKIQLENENGSIFHYFYHRMKSELHHRIHMKEYLWYIGRRSVHLHVEKFPITICIYISIILFNHMYYGSI